MLTPDEVSANIEWYQDHLERLTDEIREAGVVSANAEVDFEVAYARQRLTTRYEATENGVKVTIPAVDDTATVSTAELRRKALLAKNNLSTLREAISSAKANLESLRTLAASHRNVV